MSYAYRPFDYVPPPELRGQTPSDAPVVIVGAGPVGLAAAIDLALHGQKSIVVDDNNVVSVGSRAICWAKRTLEIFDRLGVGTRMVEKGVTWKVGRLFNGEKEVYHFDLLPEDGHKMPAFINLQQYYVEQYLIERAFELNEFIEIRFKNKVTAIEQAQDHVTVQVETPDGSYALKAQYLLACDGANSSIRGMMNLTFEGQSFEEQFLIADIKMTADFPNERWFWFNPPFHDGQTALLHKQPDDIYRIDLQLPLGADTEAAKDLDHILPRISRAVEGRPFELDWMSVYKFRCNRLDKFVHDRVIFVGDSAHVVSPFGARGGNGGIQDVDNLIWKLDLVLRGQNASLLKSYDQERIFGADENIQNSARATHFMQPPSAMEKTFRDAVLDLANRAPFARRMINSGRLSVPCSLAHSALMTHGALAPCPVGHAALDAPVEGGFLLNHLGGGFKFLGVGIKMPAHLDHVYFPSEGLMAERYGKGVYLIRPDQHIAAYWPDLPGEKSLDHALARAQGQT